MKVFLLMEVIPPFNRGGSRFYCDGVRISNHTFCLAKQLAKHREKVQTMHGVNRKGDTCTRHYTRVIFDNLPEKLDYYPFTTRRACV